MTLHRSPALLTILALTGCAGFWNPRVTEHPAPTLTDAPLPAGESLIRAAVEVAMADLHADSTTGVTAIGPGVGDSITIAGRSASAAGPARRSFLRFTNIRILPDSLGITMTFEQWCGDYCGGGGTMTLRRKPGRQWTVWSSAVEWRS